MNLNFTFFLKIAISFIAILNTTFLLSSQKLSETLEENKSAYLGSLQNTTIDESPTFGNVARFFASGIGLAVPYIGQYSNYSNSGSTVIGWKTPSNLDSHNYIVIQNLSWSNKGESPWSMKTHSWLYPNANHATNQNSAVSVQYYLTDTISSEPHPTVHIHPLSGGSHDSIMFSPNNFHLQGLPSDNLERDTITIFQSQITHPTKSANTLHILMNTINHEIYENLMISNNALTALERLIEYSALKHDTENFDKIVHFLNSTIN